MTVWLKIINEEDSIMKRTKALIMAVTVAAAIMAAGCGKTGNPETELTSSPVSETTSGMPTPASR